MDKSHFPAFYTRHKALIINLFAMLSYLGIDSSLGSRGVNSMGKHPWIAILFILVFLLEPWATYYSMGALNQKREESGLHPVFLHRWLNLGFLGIVFWAGRVALLGVLFLMSLESLHLPDMLQTQFTAVFAFLVLMVREGFVVYYMASKKPLPGFKESYDLIADLILIIILAYGQLAVMEIFRDFGIKELTNASDLIKYAFPILLFWFVFYLPIRYIHTVEDLTFSRSRAEKVEAILAAFIILLGIVIAL